MSWDRYEFDEQSSCACSKGIVVKHCYREDDDWNRYREGCTGIDIQCHEPCIQLSILEKNTNFKPYTSRQIIRDGIVCQKTYHRLFIQKRVEQTWQKTKNDEFGMGDY